MSKRTLLPSHTVHSAHCSAFLITHYQNYNHQTDIIGMTQSILIIKTYARTNDHFYMGPSNNKEGTSRKTGSW